MEVSEEFLVGLFEVVEAIIDNKALGSGIEESVRESQLKQEFINVFAFGDEPSE